MDAHLSHENRIIRFAYHLSTFFIGLLLVAFVLSSLLIIYSILFPNSLSSVIVDGILEGGISLRYRMCNSCDTTGLLTLRDLDISTKLIFLVRSSVITVITLLLWITGRKILSNLTSYSVFIDRNISYFTKLYKLTLILCLVSFINFNFVDGSFAIRFSIPFATIALACGFLLLSEIFKEGKLLEEDKNSIV